jgi:hypothetical protein
MYLSSTVVKALLNFVRFPDQSHILSTEALIEDGGGAVRLDLLSFFYDHFLILLEYLSHIQKSLNRLQDVGNEYGCWCACTLASCICKGDGTK